MGKPCAVTLPSWLCAPAIGQPAIGSQRRTFRRLPRTRRSPAFVWGGRSSSLGRGPWEARNNPDRGGNACVGLASPSQHNRRKIVIRDLDRHVCQSVCWPLEFASTLPRTRTALSCHGMTSCYVCNCPLLGLLPSFAPQAVCVHQWLSPGEGVVSYPLAFPTVHPSLRLSSRHVASPKPASAPLPVLQTRAHRSHVELHPIPM